MLESRFQGLRLGRPRERGHCTIEQRRRREYRGCFWVSGRGLKRGDRWGERGKGETGLASEVQKLSTVRKSRHFSEIFTVIKVKVVSSLPSNVKVRESGFPTFTPAPDILFSCFLFQISIWEMVQRKRLEPLVLDYCVFNEVFRL